ncbi:PilZ domain-containing protein [Qipengyuania sphaerica]|uniref:PilZ domain-containing protein n=1 Tax=Qipengyuania sphaerica TaxID=2867243 RepID=UPI001C87C9F0|nr:PilZ domain-containing protein [Qipengyuania sphaerica]MBX7541118.1 PilZ domain-containing protein [Qipengyuania sphaerica]
MDLRREQRYSITVNGRYRKGTGVRFDIAIRDLSEYGCQFADLVGRLQKDEEITIRIGEIGPIPSRVKWVEKRQAGVEFDEPLHPSVLEHIIAKGGKNEA